MTYRGSRKAFTILELMVVLSIIVVLASLAAPAYMSVRRKAAEPVCVSNLRQIWLALQLYRDQYDGKDFGTAVEMGFPPHSSSYLTLSQIESLLNGCKGEGIPPLRGYMYVWPPILGNLADEGVIEGWRVYCQVSGDPAVVADFNHQDAYPVSRYSTVKAIAVTLGGSIKRHRNVGLPYSYLWWHQDQTGGLP